MERQAGTEGLQLSQLSWLRRTGRLGWERVELRRWRLQLLEWEELCLRLLRLLLLAVALLLLLLLLLLL